MLIIAWDWKRKSLILQWYVEQFWPFWLFVYVYFVVAADLSFQEPLKIVEYPDPILRSKNKRINTFDDNLKKLVEEMFDIMYK